MGPARNLVTQRSGQAERPQHERQIPQWNQALAVSRALATRGWRGACRVCTRGARGARPAHGRRAPGRGSSQRWPAETAKRLGWRPCWQVGKPPRSSSAGDHGCGSRGQKTPRTTSTCAVRPWPSLLHNEGTKRDRRLGCAPAHAESGRRRGSSRRRPSETEI